VLDRAASASAVLETRRDWKARWSVQS